MAKLKVEMEIEQATMELPDTKTLKFKWPEGYDLDFKTGSLSLCGGRTILNTSVHIRLVPAHWIVAALR